LNSCLHNLAHLLHDELLVRVLGVAGGLHLLLGSLGERDGEKSENESVGGLGLNGGLNQGVPFLDHGASLISGNVHAVEIGVAVESLHLVDLQAHSSPGLGLSGVVAISKRNLEDTTFQTIGSLLLSSSLVARAQSNASFVEAWGEDVVPLLLHEWVSTKQKYEQKHTTHQAKDAAPQNSKQLVHAAKDPSNSNGMELLLTVSS